MAIASITLIWYYFGDNISGVFNKNLDPRERAIQVAYKEFKKLGEKGLKKEEFEVINVNKDGEESFYISSKENSIQIRKQDFKIMRINSMKISE